MRKLIPLFTAMASLAACQKAEETSTDDGQRGTEVADMIGRQLRDASYALQCAGETSGADATTETINHFIEVFDTLSSLGDPIQEPTGNADERNQDIDDFVRYLNQRVLNDSNL